MLKNVPYNLLLVCGIVHYTTCQGGLQSSRGTPSKKHGAEDIKDRIKVHLQLLRES